MILRNETNGGAKEASSWIAFCFSDVALAALTIIFFNYLLKTCTKWVMLVKKIVPEMWYLNDHRWTSWWRSYLDICGRAECIQCCNCTDMNQVYSHNFGHIHHYWWHIHCHLCIKTQDTATPNVTSTLTSIKPTLQDCEWRSSIIFMNMKGSLLWNICKNVIFM